MKDQFVVINGVDRKIKSEWVVVNGVYRKVNSTYDVVNGVYRKAYSSVPPYNPPTNYNARAGINGGGTEDGSEYSQRGNNNCYASYSYDYKELYYTRVCSVSCEINVPRSVLNELRENGYTKVRVQLYGYKNDYESSPYLDFRIDSNGTTVYSRSYYDASAHNYDATHTLPSSSFRASVYIGTVSELAYREGIYCSASLEFLQ